LEVVLLALNGHTACAPAPSFCRRRAVDGHTP